MKTAESATTTSECAPPDQWISRQPSGTRDLDFRQIRDDRSATWNAALDADVDVTEGVVQTCSLSPSTTTVP
ncbi:hypothetical protein [Haloarcula sebkhae]|uniref:Uncharacterized protein n=1 Tax=Haloarcula sebkhae TaxID=932660 RepID=A0ACC6VNJ6_9EURY|nr:hypothetical protein [Haloarcula sebkhae]